jgi:Ca2+-binding RTX toxin-like protein
MDLVVSGTPGRDSILILPVRGGLKVLRNGKNLGTFNPTGRVVVYASGGNDYVWVSPRVHLSSWLFGDGGRDSLYGGSGNNVLVGGDGRNFLYSAGRGCNLLIGGQGPSVILAPLAQNIEIGGTTDHDANEAALNAILAEWASGNAYDLRLAHLQGSTAGGANGTTLLNTSTVHDNGAVDLLFGGLGRDWYFAHNTPGHRDHVLGRKSNEVVTTI